MTWAHHAIVLVFLFGVGAAVGSFLNVCIHRIPAGMSLLRPPSRCPRCGRTIAPRDNVPILGWLALRGRCRSCGLPISARYPMVEALVGLLFAASDPAVLASLPGDPLDDGLGLAVARIAGLALLSSLLVTSAFIGLDTGRVPRRVTVTGMVLGLALGAAVPGVRVGPDAAGTMAGGLEFGLLGLLAGLTSGRLLASASPRSGPDGAAVLAMIGAFLGWRAAIVATLILGIVALVRRPVPIKGGRCQPVRGGSGLDGRRRARPVSPGSARRSGGGSA